MGHDDELGEKRIRIPCAAPAAGPGPWDFAVESVGDEPTRAVIAMTFATKSRFIWMFDRLQSSVAVVCFREYVLAA